MFIYLYVKFIKIISINFFILIDRSANGFGFFSDSVKQKDVLLFFLTISNTKYSIKRINAFVRLFLCKWITDENLWNNYWMRILLLICPKQYGQIIFLLNLIGQKGRGAAIFIHTFLNCCHYINMFLRGLSILEESIILWFCY